MSYWNEGYAYESSYEAYMGDPPEPEQPEPTLEDYCEGDGHQLEDEIPGTGYMECRCALVRLPAEGEPFDEYSAECSNLIDTYHSIILNQIKHKDGDDPHGWYANAYKGLRFQLGKALRHKSPDYLAALIASANDSLCEVADAQPWDEETLDRFVLLGVHLRSSSMLKLSNTLYGLDDARGENNTYLPFTTIALRHLDGSRALAKLCTLITGIEDKEQQCELRVVLETLLPVLEEKPEAVESAAALLNAQGLSRDTALRASVLLTEGSTFHASVADGLL